MEKILDIISHKMAAAFEEAGYDASFGRVTVSNRPDLCEYQCNGALAAAKQYKCAPIAIANAVVEKLDANDYSLVEAVMPGFINLKLSGSFLASYLNEMRTAETFGLVPGKDDEAIFAKLAELKPNVVNTYTSANNTITMLNQGEISVAVLLDYSYTTAKNANPDYVWVDPVEGSFASYNMINLIAGSDVKDLATEFINYYISYDVQLAEALDGVDSPVRTDVELTAEQSGNFTYGEEMVAGLKFVDWNIITENQAKWIEMWNSTFSVQ